MMFKKNLLLIVFSISFLYSEYTLAQQATLYGTVKSKQEIAIDGLSVEYKKIGKLQDHLEAEATDWLESYIKDLHGVNDSVELTKEQISEIDKAADDEKLDQYVALALRNIVQAWYDENEPDTL